MGLMGLQKTLTTKGWIILQNNIRSAKCSHASQIHYSGYDDNKLNVVQRLCLYDTVWNPLLS